MLLQSHFLLAFYLPCTGHVKVRVTITNCLYIKGCRRDVYRLATRSHGFYTTTVASDSIKYDSDDPRNLVVNIAFAKVSEAIDFIEGLQAWEDLHPGMVGAPEITNAYGLLRIRNVIMTRHYNAEGSNSPEASASARSIETDTTIELLADWDTKNHQNISPKKLIGGCGLQMCHIKDKRLCNVHEKDDKNNFFGMSPSLHKQFDGHGHGAIPTVSISIEEVYNGQVDVETEDGGTELRTRVDLRVKFMSQEAFDGCDGVLKDGSYKVDENDPTVWITYVYVLDPARFEYYVGFKAAQTLAMWDV